MRKIKVENLGVIEQGEVDVSKPLTIFTGANNSGKSYMAYLAYAYLTSLSPHSKENSLYYKCLPLLLDAFEKANVLKEYYRGNDIVLDLAHFAQKYFNPIANQVFSKVINDSSAEIFASSLNFRSQIDFHHTPLFGNIPKRETHLQSIATELSLENNILTLHSVNPLPEQSSIQSYIYGILSSISATNSFYFFPAERSSINLFSKEIFRQKSAQRDELAHIIQSNDNAENIVKSLKKNGTFTPRYPLAINDYLAYASDFEHFTKQPKTVFDDLAVELENTLSGKISVNQYGSLEFKPKGTRKNLPLHLSSSMVKSLSGLVIYLRHIAKENDYIIIDEPELNLHPSTQVKVARLLAKIANRGVKLIISTHSDYIIHELSNLILLNNDFKGKKALQKKYGYKQNDHISGDKISVYAFQNNTIDEVPISEQGIEIDKIEIVISDMTERSDYIYYTHLDSLKNEPVSIDS